MNLEVDTREYVAVLKEMAEQGHEVSMTVVGTSMEPFLIHNRDKIYFRKPDGTIKKGTPGEGSHQKNSPPDCFSSPSCAFGG